MATDKENESQTRIENGKRHNSDLGRKLACTTKEKKRTQNRDSWEAEREIPEEELKTNYMIERGKKYALDGQY